jgi:hypothetical protein
MKYRHIFFNVILFLPVLSQAQDRNAKQMFHVVSFYTAKNDLAHISFVHEANKWFSDAAKKYHFSYDSTDNWNNLNEDFLKNYQVVLFFDTRPD